MLQAASRAMERRKVLIVDDDPDLVHQLEHAFSRAGAQVYIAYDGREGLRTLYAQQPDLVILDTVMPVMDGWQALTRIRGFCDAPVIVLTVQGSEADTVRALKAGAADHVTKPFSVPALLARAEAALRGTGARGEASGLATYDDGYLRVDLAAHEVWLRGEQVQLTETEYGVLACLVNNAGKVLTLQDILTQVWGPAYCDAPQYVRVYVSRLRKKLEPDPSNPQYFLTVHGAGYRFQGKAPLRHRA